MNYLNATWNYRNEIISLSKQEIKKKYLETVFGPIWAIVQPLVYIITFWIFFKFGIRENSPINGVPKILFIFAGQMPWLIISQTITQGTKVFTKNSQLVKTIKFPVMALPVIDVLSKLYVHIVVMLITFLVFTLAGYPPTIYYINFIFLWPLLIIFLIGLTFLLGTLTIIIKDIPALVTSIMMPLFWLTPILYNPVGQLIIIEKIFNPFYYFIQGYRNTMLYHTFFWEQPFYTTYIIILTIIIYYLGLKLYTFIRPIMSDIL